MTIRMYANRKKIPLDEVVVELQHYREHADDCEHCDNETRQLDVLHKKLQLRGNLTDQQRQRLLEIADRCPVHRTLHGELQIRTELADT